VAASGREPTSKEIECDGLLLVPHGIGQVQESMVSIRVDVKLHGYTRLLQCLLKPSGLIHVHDLVLASVQQQDRRKAPQILVDRTQIAQTAASENPQRRRVFESLTGLERYEIGGSAFCKYKRKVEALVCHR